MIATPEIIQDLIDQGFKPYRKIYRKTLKDFEYQPLQNINLEYLRSNFNTQINGGLGIFLIKNTQCFYFGLDEKDSPPVLKKQTLNNHVNNHSTYTLDTKNT